MRQHYRQAGLWIAATALGFLLFLDIIANPAHPLAEFIVRGAMVGTLVAAVPEITLTWLVRQPLAAMPVGR